MGKMTSFADKPNYIVGFLKESSRVEVGGLKPDTSVKEFVDDLYSDQVAQGNITLKLSDSLVETFTMSYPKQGEAHKSSSVAFVLSDSQNNPLDLSTANLVAKAMNSEIERQATMNDKQ